MKKILHKLFIEPSIMTVSTILTTIAIVIPILFSIIKEIFSLLLSDFQLFGFILLSILMSANGLIQVIRKEIPGFGIDHSIKGRYAVISGAILFFVFLCGAIFLIVGRIILGESFF